MSKLSSADFAAIQVQARVLHAHAELVQRINALGRAVDDALAGEEAVFITVMNGALPFAGHLALAIGTPLQFDYAHASRYHGSQGKALEWRHRPAAELTGRTVLLVDDILDEGHTLDAVRAHCIERGARRVLVAVLCRKLHARRRAAITADFCAVEVLDAFVFGFGMDWDGHGRNLPHIYAPAEP